MVFEPGHILQSSADHDGSGLTTVAQFVSRDTKLHRTIKDNPHLNDLIEKLRSDIATEENSSLTDDEIRNHLASTLVNFESLLKSSLSRYEEENEKQFFKNLQWGMTLLKGIVAIKLQNDAVVNDVSQQGYNVPLDQKTILALHDVNKYTRHFARAAADVMKSDGIEIKEILNDVVPISFVDFIQECLDTNGDVKKGSVINGIQSEVAAALARKGESLGK